MTANIIIGRQRSEEEILNEMHNLTDVVMAAIHESFDGKDLCIAAFSTTLVVIATKEAERLGIPDPKAFIHSAVEGVDLSDIEIIEEGFDRH